MIRISRELELISPCFLGGAEAENRAEIRPTSIRGQLRWWFRILGGFKSLTEKGISLRKQEDLIFGAAADDDTHAGLLTVRTSGLHPTDETRDDQGMKATIYDDRGYFLFPLRATDQGRTSHARAVFNPDLQVKGPTFSLTLLWRGGRELKSDLECLFQVFAELGSLGYRSRRAMGALAIRDKPSLTLSAAIAAFNNSAAINVRYLSCKDASNAIDVLARWLRSWKSHGRSIDHPKNIADTFKPPLNSGFEWALRDHDEGYAASGLSTLGTASHGCIPKGIAGETFRPALGLPVVQGLNGSKMFWYPKFESFKAVHDRQYKGEGRFASPVILRPHKDADGNWRALVIFVDAKKWQTGQKVYLNGCPKDVSLDLYDAMKADPRLSSFP